jgi:hypothetical protein
MMILMENREKKILGKTPSYNCVSVDPKDIH